MAVSRFANVIKVPAADAGTTMLVAWTGDQKQPARITGVRWVVSGGGATAGTSTAVIQDVDGNVLWESFALATNVAEESNVMIRARGIKVPTLSAGTLYIYLACE